MTPWIIRTRRTVAETVPALPEQVRAFYVDLDNIVAVHPLVVGVRSTGRRDTPGGYTQTYRVRDRIPLPGSIALPISYRVEIVVPSDGDVTTDSRQFPGIRLRSLVSFTAVMASEGNAVATRIVENIDIAAPAPLAGVTVRQATAAHVEMLSGIRRRFTPS